MCLCIIFLILCAVKCLTFASLPSLSFLSPTPHPAPHTPHPTPHTPYPHTPHTPTLTPHRHSTVFLLQDMRCPVTKSVSTRHCAATSALCAPLQMDVTVPTVRAQLSLLQRVSQYHGFEWLESTLGELLV